MVGTARVPSLRTRTVTLVESSPSFQRSWQQKLRRYVYVSRLKQSVAQCRILTFVLDRIRARIPFVFLSRVPFARIPFSNIILVVLDNVRSNFIGISLVVNVGGSTDANFVRCARAPLGTSGNAARSYGR